MVQETKFVWYDVSTTELQFIDQVYIPQNTWRNAIQNSGEKGHLPEKEGKTEKLWNICARPVVGGQFGCTLYPNTDLIICDHLEQFDFQNLVILLLFYISKMLKFPRFQSTFASEEMEEENPVH